MICWIVRIGGCIRLSIGNIGKHMPGKKKKKKKKKKNVVSVGLGLCMYVKR